MNKDLNIIKLSGEKVATNIIMEQYGENFKRNYKYTMKAAC